MTIARIDQLLNWINQNLRTDATPDFTSLKKNGTEITATAAELNIMDGVTATAAEINRACDAGSRIVTLTASLSITEALHEGKICLLAEPGGNAELKATLPEATGTGGIYRFVVTVVNTSNYIISTADATDASFYGSVNMVDLDAAAQEAYAPAATDELITLNGTTQGGVVGCYLEFIDIAADMWMVFGQLQVPAGSDAGTPFSGA